MSDLHIDDFYKDAGKILAQLYRAFPRKTLLLVEDISGADTPDEYGLHSVRHQACFGTAIWLAESGYIRYAETLRQEGLDEVVLTHKGFTLLSARANHLPEGYLGDSDLPESVIAAQQTNIHQLREALKSGSSVEIGQVMQQMLLQSHQH
ncbi:hypothetical protein [Pseudomaricurvus sp. HS19]|uniref:hypothetical protein n=1 Tax=Pseudomaricurvus sp. HS19 TaxID=2692626 RepID=UPI00136841AE|nr:hypothetical protein [Pseudomaricurvus sp. HS19]MYM61787.1 hypothetical protein [Pseudomaricurvus sp. HS19]